MEESTISLLSDSFLFRGIAREDTEALLRTCHPQTRRFAREETIYAPQEYERRLGFVLSGECAVEKMRDTTAIPMNTLHPGDSFGILALFSEQEGFPTRVYAKKPSEVLFFSKSEIESLIAASPALALNIIRFLSGRVDFLNGKISHFCAGSAEKKLAAYLLGEYHREGDVLPFNHAAVARRLGIGRASLYRALDTLCDAGILKNENKKIYIISPEKLERIQP